MPSRAATRPVWEILMRALRRLPATLRDVPLEVQVDDTALGH